MAFKMRTTKPEAGNKYYITKSKGGYSDAVQGSPTDKDCNVLSNCVGYAYGRFNEIGGYGKCKYLYPTNAENFMSYKGDLKVGQTPKLGACMVWQKGATSKGADGAGHVAIVEKVISDTEVITSESGWKASRPFWNQTRKKGSGNWGQNSNYKFLGFIYNPAVTDSDAAVEENKKPTTTDATINSFKYKVGDIVQFTGSVHYESSISTSPKKCKAGTAKVVNRIKGKKHPYCLVAEKGGESTVHGWVDEKDIAGKVTSVSGNNVSSNASANTSVKPQTKIDSAQAFLKSLTGTYSATADLNMRSGAGTSKTVLTVIPKGGKVSCYGYYTTVNGTKWYYVTYRNSKGTLFTGFVSSKYLKK